MFNIYYFSFGDNRNKRILKLDLFLQSYILVCKLESVNIVCVGVSIVRFVVCSEESNHKLCSGHGFLELIS